MIMKEKLLFFLLGCILVASCGEEPKTEESPLNQVFSGEHELRKMKNFSTVDSKVSSSFFLFSGNLSAESKGEVYVIFSWKMNDGTYAISRLPIERFRIKLVQAESAPIVKYQWRGYQSYMVNTTDNLQEVMDYYINYALLIINEKDWPEDIRLPLNDN